MSCSENTLLKGVKDKQKELDTLLEQGKDGLASMQSKMDELKADLTSFVPVIPEVPSLQGDLLKLGDITSAGGLASKIAELKASMGSAVPDFDSLISGLGLDSFPPTINSADICSTMPNVETIDGEATVVPAESKIPEEEPKKPEPKEEIKPDKEELNKSCIISAYKDALRDIMDTCLALEPDVKRRNKMKIRQLYFDYTWPEAWNEIYEAGGSDIDELKKFDYPKDVLRHLQSQLDAAYPLGHDFVAKGQIMAAKYDLMKTLLTSYADADDFTTACTEAVARRKKKLG